MKAILILIIILKFTLRFMTWNMSGVMYGTPHLIALLPNVDIAIITEHWLHQHSKMFLCNLSSVFNVVLKCEKESKGCKRGFGGIAVMYRKTIHFKIENIEICHDHIITIKIMRSGYENVYVIGTPLPSTNYTNEQYLTAIDNVCEVFDKYSSDGACVVAGDLNADIHRQD